MAGPVLPEELLLAAHPADRPFGWHGGVLAVRVAGAALGELVLAGRVAPHGKALRLTGGADPIGHPLLDAMLADTAAAGAGAAVWVHGWAPRAYAHARDALLAGGALRHERHRRLWWRTDVTHLAEGHPGRAEVIERLREPADRRDRLLAGLLHALGREPAEDAWVIDTVRRATRISVD
ncbi:MAG TPA: GPP34 family phosphoprotein [Dactylosporangium sp.]|jgi:hypothetical protein|nr:GPP34 family phosphoprotein [Dactylosporangium sp.]